MLCCYILVPLAGIHRDLQVHWAYGYLFHFSYWDASTSDPRLLTANSMTTLRSCPAYRLPLWVCAHNQQESVCNSFCFFFSPTASERKCKRTDYQDLLRGGELHSLLRCLMEAIMVMSVSFRWKQKKTGTEADVKNMQTLAGEKVIACTVLATG